MPQLYVCRIISRERLRWIACMHACSSTNYSVSQLFLYILPVLPFKILPPPLSLFPPAVLRIGRSLHEFTDSVSPPREQRRGVARAKDRGLYDAPTSVPLRAALQRPLLLWPKPATRGHQRDRPHEAHALCECGAGGGVESLLGAQGGKVLQYTV